MNQHLMKSMIKMAIMTLITLSCIELLGNKSLHRFVEQPLLVTGFVLIGGLLRGYLVYYHESKAALKNTEA